MQTIFNSRNWEELGQEFRSARPYPSICIDDFLDTEFANQLVADYPDLGSAKQLGKEFRSVNERQKVQLTDPLDFPDSVKSLSAALGSQEFISILTILTGIRNLQWDPGFTGGGMHLTGPTGILDVHVDFNFEKKLNLYRRLNILIYLNPGWKSAWGGNVELWDKSVTHLVKSFEPIHNRCVLFETSDYSWHGVEQVRTPEGISRNSFAAYYYTEEPGNNEGLIYGGYHSTIFRARPEETVKKYFSMPLEALNRKRRKLIAKIKSKIKG